MYDMKALYQAKSVQDAVALRVAHPEAQIIAGGSRGLGQMREGQRGGGGGVSIYGGGEIRGVALGDGGSLRDGPHPRLPPRPEEKQQTPQNVPPPLRRGPFAMRKHYVRLLSRRARGA